MKAALFDYVRATTLDAGLTALADTQRNPKVMGGSQSLGPMLNLRLTRPELVVDISTIPELCSVTSEGDVLRIGAGVTHAQIEDGVFPELRGGLLQQVAGGIAYRAVRNRGTLGGSLAHADPAADWVLTMTAMAAQIHLASAQGRRVVPMDRFMIGAYTTVLEPGEVIAAVRVPRLSADARWGYYKSCRKVGEFAEASCAAVFDPQRRLARIVIGALDGAPQPLPKLAAQVAGSGRMPAQDEIQAAVAASAPSADVVERKLLTAAVRRCLAQVLGQETQA